MLSKFLEGSTLDKLCKLNEINNDEGNENLKNVLEKYFQQHSIEVKKITIRKAFNRYTQNSITDAYVDYGKFHQAV